MGKKKEFLIKMFGVLRNRQEILEFLAEQKVITKTDIQTILLTNHNTHAGQIATLLENAVKEEQLQLVDYEWSILPVEKMCLTIVSDSTKKEWRYR
jgi:predicted HTH transcriptional regulator